MHIDDIKIKTGQFYSQFNKNIAHFSCCNHIVLAKLFYTYCHSFYGSQMWSLNKQCITTLYTAWNKAVRRMLCLPYATHRNLLGPILNIPHISKQLCNRFNTLHINMLNSKNVLVKNMVKRSIINVNSSIGSNILFIYNQQSPSVDHTVVTAICDCIDGNMPGVFTVLEISQFLEDLCCR